MNDVALTVQVPPNTSALAQGIAALFATIIANTKGGASPLIQITEDVTAAIGDLAPALANVTAIGSEASAEPIGVAEAFSIAGFQVARSLTGK